MHLVNPQEQEAKDLGCVQVRVNRQKDENNRDDNGTGGVPVEFRYEQNEDRSMRDEEFSLEQISSQS